jgi:hypothetical protein
MIPDSFLQESKYANELTAIRSAVNEHPFDHRKKIIKWRGSLSGSHYPDVENYRSFTRFLLVKMALTCPDILDARFTSYDFGDDPSSTVLKYRLEEELGASGDYIPAEGFVEYKYLISVDGVASSWKRVATILASGSVLLMQHRWNQFFYPGLKPWVHYVPIANDFSDLVRRYQWLSDHPSQAKHIAENGLRFAREILYPASLETYFLGIVNKCSQLYCAR